MYNTDIPRRKLLKQFLPLLDGRIWHEGSYQLSHAYDRFLDATADRRVKTRKNWVPASSDEDFVMRSKRQNKV